MEIAVITSGTLPVPAVKGGAVESLFDSVVSFNERFHDFDFVVYSVFDPKVLEAEKGKKYCRYVFIKNLPVVKLMDCILFFLVHKLARLNNVSHFKGLFYRFYFFYRVEKALEKQNFDLILIENNFLSYSCLRSLKNRHKYSGKVVFHCHNYPKHYRHFFKQIAMTNTIISVSEAVNSANKKIFSKYKQIRFCVLRNGSDPILFFPIHDSIRVLSIKKKYGISGEAHIVLFAGRIVPEKGVFELLDAFSGLPKDYFLILAGSFCNGTKMANKESTSFAQRLSALSGRYLVTGFVDHCKMNEIYNIADVVVLPSTGFEAAPLTVLEASLCGRPIITTNIGGIPEYTNRVASIILPVNSALSQNIHDSIIEVCSNKKKAEAMSCESVRLSEGMAIDVFYHQFSFILKSILASPSSVK